MKKFLIGGLIGAFLLSAMPVRAENRLGKIPQKELTEDLLKFSVCMMDNLVAVRVVEKIYKDKMQEQETAAGILLITTALGNAVQHIGKVNSYIVDALMETYHVPQSDLEKLVGDAIKTAKTDMTDQLKDVSDGAEFVEVFGPIAKQCNDFGGKFSERLQNLQE